jgi:hypothetical protein
MQLFVFFVYEFSSFSFFVVLGLELRAYTTSPVFVMDFFEVGGS